MDHRKYRVGTLHIRKHVEVTEYYECAAWHKTVRCPAGSYPVYAHLSPGNVSERYLGHTLSAPFEGEITSACFVARLGAHYGRDEGPAMVGKKSGGHIKLPTYDLRRYVERGDLELDPDLVVAEPFTSPDDGRERIFYRLAGNGSDEGFLQRLRTAEEAS